mmetsp:Transcript_5132/g.20639  ORF Transcript_5132/g.20639 Transcript_5132/m.20639 type:complete len:586 (-) Transcript_5132:2301-4058(-)
MRSRSGDSSASMPSRLRKNRITRGGGKATTAGATSNPRLASGGNSSVRRNAFSNRAETRTTETELGTNNCASSTEGRVRSREGDQRRPSTSPSPPRGAEEASGFRSRSITERDAATFASTPSKVTLSVCAKTRTYHGRAWNTRTRVSCGLRSLEGRCLLSSMETPPSRFPEPVKWRSARNSGAYPTSGARGSGAPASRESFTSKNPFPFAKGGRASMFARSQVLSRTRAFEASFDAERSQSAVCSRGAPATSDIAAAANGACVSACTRLSRAATHAPEMPSLPFLSKPSRRDRRVSGFSASSVVSCAAARSSATVNVCVRTTRHSPSSPDFVVSTRVDMETYGAPNSVVRDASASATPARSRHGSSFRNGVRFSTHTLSDGSEPCFFRRVERVASRAPFQRENANAGSTTISLAFMRDSDAQNRPPMCAVSASQSSECASAEYVALDRTDAFAGGAWKDAQSSAPIGFVPTGARPHLLSSQRPCVNDSSASATRVSRAICAIALGKLSKCRDASGALCLKCATNTALPSGRGRTSASSSNVSAPARDPSATPARDATSAAKSATRGIERRALRLSDVIAHPVTAR